MPIFLNFNQNWNVLTDFSENPICEISQKYIWWETKLDKEKNQCIRQKTGAQNIVKEIKQYQEKWLQHVQRMDTNRLPKQALQYNQKEEEA
jgi:hypothetical protein